MSVTIVFIQLNMYNNLIILTNWQYYKGYRVREFKLLQSKYILLYQLSRLCVYIEYKLWKEGLTLNTNKGNKKITELLTIFQKESQNSKVYQQTKSVNSQKTVETVMTLTWYRHFQRNGGLNQILRRQTPRFHYGSKVPAVTITVCITILEQNIYFTFVTLV